MSRRKSDRLPACLPERPWSVPVALSEVPDTGRQIDLVADGQVRAAVAELAALAALPRLEAGFDLTLHGRNGLHVVGRVSATVGQTCVVTLEPIENEIEEPIDLVFSSAAAPRETPHRETHLPARSGEALEGALIERDIAAEDLTEPGHRGAVGLQLLP